MRQAKKQAESEQTIIRAPIVDMKGATVRWNRNNVMPRGTVGKVLEQRVPMRNWIVLYVDFGEYGEHYVSAKNVVIA